MSGIQFEHTGFEVSNRVHGVLEGIAEKNLKNYILASCGKELTMANSFGQSCNIERLVPEIQDVSAKLQKVQRNWQEATSMSTWPFTDKIFEDLNKAFADDVTDMLINGCGCQNK